MCFYKVLKIAVISFFALVVIFIMERRFNPTDIIFYQGLKLVVIFFIGGFASVFILNRTGAITYEATNNSYLIILLASLLFYCFHITVPSLLDRSISLYIIGVSEKKTDSTIYDYRKQFYYGFIVKNQAVEKRLNEQIVTGNIECRRSTGCNLTKKGRIVYKLNNWLVGLFNLDDKYVNPEIYLGD